MMPENLYHSTVDSPLGKIELYANDKGIRYCYFADSHKIKPILRQLSDERTVIIDKENKILKLAKSQFNAYFNRELKNFDVPIDLIGTDFQKKVWKSLLNIPYGKTWSYLQQSHFLNNPKAVRAVANANGKNPISIIIPCHRVIGNNRKLTGYAGGISRKKYLLELENPIPQLEF